MSTERALAVTLPKRNHCACVKAHRPPVMDFEHHHVWPKGMNGPTQADNLIWICANTHNNVHEIMRTFVKADKILPRTEGTPEYSYALAVEGFRRFKGEAWHSLDPMR